MLTTIRGVWREGSPEDPTLAAVAPQSSVRVRRGESATVRALIVRPSLEPVDLARLSATLTLAVSRRPSDVAPLLQASGAVSPLLGRGWVEFSISAAATKFWCAGLYCYAVWMVQAGQRDAVVPASQLILEPGLLLP